MPLVYNPTREKQSVQIFGNYFVFQPEQIKNMNDNIAQYIQTDRRQTGLVVLPVQFEEDATFKDTEEGKALMKAKKEEGLTNYLAHLRWLVSNNQVSLRRDLDQANIKSDPAFYASSGELDAMRTLSKYQKMSDDEAQVRAEEVKKLVEKIGAGKQ